MDDLVLLYDSTFCRLCAEENENGISLFATDENEPDLCSSINRYLPLKVQNDSKWPRTICPGCNIQLDAMVQFMELIINGQERLRELFRNQQEELKRREKSKLLLEQGLFNTDSNLATPFTIQAIEENGKELIIQVMPDGSLYAPEHEMTLKVEGLEKPRRKRGRPPKPPPGTVIEEMKEDQEPEPEEEEEDADGRKRRRRKVPSRFKEAVQGKELERIFREEGVIDEEDESDEEELGDERSVEPLMQDTGDEIIGHLENKDGQDLGELVIISKQKTKLRTKGRRRKNFSCEICGRGFMHYGRYMVHKTFHKGVRYECNTCSELFNTRTELSEHQTLLNHSGEGIVESLNNEVAEEQELTQQEPEPKQPDPISPEHKYPCDQCDKAFMSKQSYEVHVKAIHEGQKPFQCEKCDKTFAYQASLRGHMSSHEQKTDKGYACDICDKVFNHPSSVVYHKEAEHNNGRRFVCNKCGKSFKHKQLLQRHQLVHTDDRPFICKACGASFKTRANLLNHQPTHTGVKKYFCQQCGQMFAHKTSLTLHYRWHSGQKPYECNVCKKAFSQKGNLQEHKRIHTGEKPYACGTCGRKFTTSSQFKLHMKRHTGERPWSCEYCSKTFLHKDTWKCHMRRHRNERPFQCPSCMRDFTEQWALKKHLRLHTGEKPYVCEICNKAFADCSNLTKHKRVHRNVKEEAPSLTTPDVATDSNVIYVTYQDQDSNEIPALVQILNEDSNGSSLNAAQALSQTDESIENTLLPTADQSTELRLEDFDDEDASLPLTAGQLHVTDEEGNPIYFTAQDGQQIRVTSFDGQNLQVCMDDGSIIPIQMNAENGKPVAVEMADVPEHLKKDFKLDDDIIIPELPVSKPNIVMGSEVSSLMDQSVQFMTEDGENVCLVAAYNIDSDNLNSAYLPIA